MKEEREERVLMSGFLIFHRCPSKDRLSEYLNRTALEIACMHACMQLFYRDLDVTRLVTPRIKTANIDQEGMEKG